MKIAEFIPQVFYDMIARIAPGLIILATIVAIWFDELIPLREVFTEMFNESPVIVSMVMVLIAYVVAIILEGVRSDVKKFIVFFAKLAKHQSGKQQRCTQWSEAWDDFCNLYPNYEVLKPSRPADAVVIDVLRLLNPSVGSRIVKLRAEVTLCQTLGTGWAVIFVLLVLYMLLSHIMPNLNSKLSAGYCITALLLLIGIRAITNRCISIDNRHLRALYNHWLLLVSPGVISLSDNSNANVPVIPIDPPAMLIPMDAVRSDLQLKDKGRGYRKILVTKIYEDIEKPATEIVWNTPQEDQLSQVLLTNNIEVSMFSQAASQDLHVHKLATEIYCVLDGKMEINVNSEPFTLQRGDMIVIKPGTIHKICETNNKFFCSVITTNCHGAEDKYCV